MTFWDFVYKVWPVIENRIGRILAVVSGSVAIIAAAGVISLKQLPYWMLSLALLNYWRGQATGKTYANAKAVLAANPPTVETAAVVASATIGVPPILNPTSPVKPASGAIS